MELFIVRPFGVKSIYKQKSGMDPVKVDVNFEEVDSKLIRPALEKAGVKGGTTGDIFESGSIKADMFSLLLTADIVIADISIHNANVYYELGVRHALRNCVTILIKSPGLDDVPFDIQGFRYLNYDRQDLSNSVDSLANMILKSVDSNKSDSPVFDMIPGLAAQNPEKFIAIDELFANEMHIAGETGECGVLKLLADESAHKSWHKQALRAIGNKLFDLKKFEWSMSLFEGVLERLPNDLESNYKLATIYQRLANFKSNPQLASSFLERSNICIGKILQQKNHLKEGQVSEVYSLLGRNAKTSWLESWNSIQDLTERQKAALLSPFLHEALSNYETAYLNSLNHFYSGINALGLMQIVVTLAERFPDDWKGYHKSDAEAFVRLNYLKEQILSFGESLKLALDAEKRLLDEIDDPKHRGDRPIWYRITLADHTLLTNQNDTRIIAKYKDALINAKDFNKDAIYNQLHILRELDILKDSVEKVLGLFTLDIKAPDVKHVILFTGHMIDAPDRPSPRFPSSKEQVVRAALRDTLIKIRDTTAGKVVGIAGCACGGDILFHELCTELNIPTEVYLLVPEQAYKQKSVSFAGSDWIDRFDKITSAKPKHFLQKSLELPGWLEDAPNYTVWERNNLWMLWSAAMDGWRSLTFVAIWDGKTGDGPGGTKHMVDVIRSKGGRSIVINPAEF